MARNLGEIYPVSEGICGSGSNVYISTNGACKTGTGASNQQQGCAVGTGASGAGCISGTNPNPAVSCTNGYIAY